MRVVVAVVVVVAAIVFLSTATQHFRDSPVVDITACHKSPEGGETPVARAPPRNCVHRAGRLPRKCTSPPCKARALRRVT